MATLSVASEGGGALACEPDQLTRARVGILKRLQTLFFT